jgi:hypothetical protein
MNMIRFFVILGFCFIFQHIVAQGVPLVVVPGLTIRELPFKSVSINEKGLIRYGVKYSEISISTYDDFNLHTVVEDEGMSCAIRFPNQFGFYFFVISVGALERRTDYLVVMNQTGKVLSTLQAKVVFFSRKGVSPMQYTVGANGVVTLHRIHVLSAGVIDGFKPVAFQGQRVDKVYQISASGEFLLKKEIKFVPKTYTPTELQGHNIMDGTESVAETIVH